MTRNENDSLTVERVFDATPQDLWDACTDPEQYKKWYGPMPNEDLVIHAFELRVGGRIHFDMPTPGGPKPTRGVFLVLDEPERIVYGAEDGSWTLDTRIEPHPKGAKMTAIATGGPAEMRTPEFRRMATMAWESAFRKLDRVVG